MKQKILAQKGFDKVIGEYDAENKLCSAYILRKEEKIKFPFLKTNAKTQSGKILLDGVWQDYKNGKLTEYFDNYIWGDSDPDVTKMSYRKWLRYAIESLARYMR